MHRVKTHKKSEWTCFSDMHSGGGLKEKRDFIFIEAPENEAKVIFYNRFGHNPERVSCTCCGDDYSISSGPSFLQVSGFYRGCHFDDKKNCYLDKPSAVTRFGVNNYQTDAKFKKRKDVLVISADKIKAAERKGEVPKQGYVYID